MDNNNNNFVAMEQEQCVVCGELYNTGNILIHKHLRNIRTSVTGTGLCPEHQKLYDDGYTALVVANPISDNKKSVKWHEADRTGEIIHMRKRVAIKFFQLDSSITATMLFIAPELSERIKNMTQTKEV